MPQTMTVPKLLSLHPPPVIRRKNLETIRSDLFTTVESVAEVLSGDGHAEGCIMRDGTEDAMEWTIRGSESGMERVLFVVHGDVWDLGSTLEDAHVERRDTTVQRWRARERE